MSKNNKSIKYLVLILIVILQIFDLSCGPSMTVMTFNNKTEVSKLSNLMYKDHVLFFENLSFSDDKKNINGKIFYTPNYIVIAKTKYTKDGFNQLFLSNLLDLSLISLLVGNQINNKNDNNIWINLATGYLFLDLFLGANSIYNEFFDNNERKIFLMKKSYSIKLPLVSNELKEIYSKLEKEKIKNSLGESTFFLSKICSDKSNFYKLKIEKDGTFSIPYNIYSNYKICSFEKKEKYPYVNFGNEVYFHNASSHIYSDVLK